MSKAIKTMIAAGLIAGSVQPVQAEGGAYVPVNVQVPAAAVTYSSVSLIWDKPEDYKPITGYRVYMNGEPVFETAANETYYTAEGLEPDTEYKLSVSALIGNDESEQSEEITAKTDIKGTVRDVTAEPYNAAGDGVTLDTAAIQSAIDDCEKNDIVLIPEGKTFLTGALDLKSDMTFEVNGTLLSSSNAADFEKQPESCAEYTEPVISGDRVKTTVSNNTGAAKTAVMLVASYENGIMKGLSVSQEASVEDGGNAELEAAAPVTEEYRIMVWESAQSMKPLSRSDYSGGTAAGAVYTAEADKRLIWSRIEGWEQYCYRSLINIGYIDKDTDYSAYTGYVCSNVKICGSGTITGDSYRGNYPPINGNATALAIDEGNSADEFYDIDASETSENNIRSRIRGRLINISNAQNVYIKGVTLEKPPMWTVHMIYSDNVTTNGVTFNTSGYRNGDGWDPDSSTNCTIYDCDFSTGDDCIAIKSGKNPEGNSVARPSENIRIIGCRSAGGLGLAVGSEMSGGVEGVYVRDCDLSDTRYGIELKANKVRGGYIRNFNVQDCEIDRILIHSVSYNADGEPAPESPVFSDISFVNTNVRGCSSESSDKWLSTSIELEGFTSDDGSDRYYLRNILFKDMVIGTENNVTQNISMKYCRGIAFENVLQSDGSIPLYAASDAEFTVNGGSLEDIVPEFSSAIEAERMNLTNFISETNSAASGGTLVKINGSAIGSAASAKAIYNGESGTKDICVTYFDENDGIETYTLYINDIETDSWEADQDLGSDSPDETTRTHHITQGVSIEKGDTVRLDIEVKKQYGAGRFDKLEIGEPGSFEIDEPDPLPEGISGTEENGVYTWSIGRSGTDTVYTDTNDHADLTVSLGDGDSMDGNIVWSAASVREPNTSGQSSVNETKRYLLVQPKRNGSFDIEIAFPDAASNKKQRVYYADLGEGIDASEIDLSQYFKASHETAGEDITSSGRVTRTIEMEAGHTYIIYTYQHGSRISGISYRITD